EPDLLDYLKDLFLPSLKALKIKKMYFSLEWLTNLIENTKGNLTEISIYPSFIMFENERIIQIIYQNCPKLKYFKLYSDFNNNNMLELEKLLINCQYLNELHFRTNIDDDMFDWDNLFKILTNSSPIDLFKFKFKLIYIGPKSKSLKLFFDNWK